MKLTHEKITHLSHVIVKALEAVPGVSFERERNEVRLKVVELLRAELRKDEEVERRVRAKIVSQKRAIPEGGQEWDILFRKYYEEELNKIRNVRG